MYIEYTEISFNSLLCSPAKGSFDIFLFGNSQSSGIITLFLVTLAQLIKNLLGT